ncbi:hypothetical protein [Piscinibacter sp. XHJ-5]|uniref:hypothetical protein n=1 Tax=Piscinibacter sp. XHJ-5 TaxID=3037797 RepID=UPI002452A472|nr:hypothetical protein [Piscinibacter sp. XHJ-5]
MEHQPDLHRDLSELSSPRIFQATGDTPKQIHALIESFAAQGHSYGRVCSIPLSADKGALHLDDPLLPVGVVPGVELSGAEAFLSPQHKAEQAALQHIAGTLLMQSGQGKFIVDHINALNQDDLRLVVDVHLCAEYPMAEAGFLRRDSIGRTLFSIHAYDHDVAIPGPEILLNPPPLSPIRWLRGDLIKGLVPPAFLTGLSALWSQPPGNSIACAEMPPHGCIGWIEELVYHTQPLTSQRQLHCSRQDFASIATQALALVENNQEAQAFWARWLAGQTGMAPRSDLNAPSVLQQLLLHVCDARKGALTQADVQPVTAMNPQVGQMLLGATIWRKPSTFVSTKLRWEAKTQGGMNAVVDGIAEGHQKLPGLTRQMSQKVVEGTVLAEPPKRRFVRLLVMAVPRRSIDAGLRHVAHPVNFQADAKVAADTRTLLQWFGELASTYARICSLPLSVKGKALDLGTPGRPMGVLPGYENGAGPAYQRSETFLVGENQKLHVPLRNVVLSLLERSGQAKYIVDNADAMLGDKWKLVVDVHFCTKFPAEKGGYLRRDSPGNVLFSAIVYDHDQPIPGPEYVLNPRDPSGTQWNPSRAECIKRMAPTLFLEHLGDQWVKLPLGSEIVRAPVGPHGCIAWVEELVHHSQMPLLQHRPNATVPKAVFLYRLGMELHRCFGFERANAFQQAYASGRPLHNAAPVESMLMNICTGPGDDVSVSQIEQLAQHDAALAKALQLELDWQPAAQSPDPMRHVTMVDGHLQSQQPMPRLVRQVSQELTNRTALPAPAKLRFIRALVMAVPRS